MAIAAHHVGAPATIVMPADAPRIKMEPTRDQGARIVTYDRMRENREAIAEQILKETGGTLVPPFDHPMIMAGQGTTALELLEVIPHLDALIAARRRRRSAGRVAPRLPKRSTRISAFSAPSPSLPTIPIFPSRPAVA